MHPLFKIISAIESSDNYTALRFEPSVYRKISSLAASQSDLAIISKIKKINNCSTETAYILYSSSFGAVQIMGFNIWGSLGLTCSYYEFLNSESAQQVAFAAFLEKLRLANETPESLLNQKNRDTFAGRYNGDVAAYSPLLLKSINQHGYK